MPEISYKDLQKKLKSTKVENYPGIILIYGEEFLYKSALNMIVELLLPESSRKLNFDPLDGVIDNIPKAVERINTYCLVPGTKIVALRDAKIFYTKEDKGKLLHKAKVEVENNEMKKAAEFFTAFLSNFELDFADVEGEKRFQILEVDPNEDPGWITKVLAYCRNNDISVAKRPSDMVGFLIEAIKRGFPKDHYMIITTDLAAKTHRLYKAIVDTGWIIDCSVPKGEKKADKIQQEFILNERMRDILAKRGKSIEKEAYYAMLDMIGFDIRTFVNDLEKLVNYLGERETITLGDVENLLKHTRQAPIFELTNAVTERNFESSLFFLESMIASGVHPLQVLTALGNQIRKMIIAKAFTESMFGTVWKKGASYNYFQKNVVPAVLEYDDLLRNRLKFWDEYLSKPKIKGKKKTAKSGTAESSDLFLMRYAKNPYPTYQLLKNSDNFTLKSLKAVFNKIGEADMLMKSTAQNPKRVLENILFESCRTEY